MDRYCSKRRRWKKNKRTWVATTKQSIVYLGDTNRATDWIHFGYIFRWLGGRNSVDWKNFVEPIQKAKISNGAQSKILEHLFVLAGRKYEFAESTAKSWLSGKRGCKAFSYFPDGKIDTKSVFDYFRGRPDGRLMNLQKIFRENMTCDSDSPIDVETDNLDLFCWSLVNQFLDLLGFERVTPDIDMPSKASHQQGTGISTDTALLESEVSTSGPGEFSLIDSAGISDAESRSIRSMFLPHSDDCCYHCVYWLGNRKMFGAYMTPTYGFCLKYNREGQLSAAVACKDFQRRQKSAGDW